MKFMVRRMLQFSGFGKKASLGRKAAFEGTGKYPAQTLNSNLDTKKGTLTSQCRGLRNYKVLGYLY